MRVIGVLKGVQIKVRDNKGDAGLVCRTGFAVSKPGTGFSKLEWDVDGLNILLQICFVAKMSETEGYPSIPIESIACEFHASSLLI